MAGAPNAAQPGGWRPRARSLSETGPNPLGSLAPQICGHKTLRDIIQRGIKIAAGQGARPEPPLNDRESALIDRVGTAKKQRFVYIIVKHVRFTHSSVALHDGLAAISVSFIEGRWSNIHHARAPFRQRSDFSELAVGMNCGLGSRGYDPALEYALAS